MRNQRLTCIAEESLEDKQVPPEAGANRGSTRSGSTIRVRDLLPTNQEKEKGGGYYPVYQRLRGKSAF